MSTNILIEKIKNYRESLRDNGKLLSMAIEDEATAYPHLRKIMLRNGGGMYWRLQGMLKYFSLFDGTPSYDEYRGVEFYASFKDIVEFEIDGYTRIGGGIDTMWKHMQLMLAMELLYVHKPDHHKDEHNTEQQNFSKHYAAQQGKQFRAINYYHVLPFTPNVLKRADERAAVLLTLPMRGVCRNAIETLLGERVAKLVDDSIFGIADNIIAQERQETIENALEELVRKNGYTTEAELIEMVHDILEPDQQKETNEYGKKPKELHSRYLIRRELKWMLNGLGVKYSKPTKEEHERFQLNSWQYIIR